MANALEEDFEIAEISGWPSVIRRDIEGNIVAAIILHRSVPQLEFIISPEHRGMGLWKEMAELMKRCSEECKPYYAICRSDKVAGMASAMGMKEIEGARVFIME